MRLRLISFSPKFIVFSDHKPLKYIFNNERCSPKVLRWKLQLQEFNFTVDYCQGTQNIVADCFSRINVLTDDVGELIVGEDDVTAAQMFDYESKSMVNCVEKGIMVKPCNISLNLWKLRSNLSIKNGVLLNSFGKKFVPFKFRHKMLTVAHGCHHGISQTIERLRNKFFWYA